MYIYKYKGTVGIAANELFNLGPNTHVKSEWTLIHHTLIFVCFFFHFHFPWLCAGVKNQNVHCKLFFRIYCWTLLTKVFICSRRSGEGGARVLRSTPDWGDGAVSGEHLWTPTSVSGDCCYVGDAECQVYIQLTDPRQGRHFYSMKAGLCV